MYIYIYVTIFVNIHMYIYMYKHNYANIHYIVSHAELGASGGSKGSKSVHKGLIPMVVTMDCLV